VSDTDGILLLLSTLVTSDECMVDLALLSNY
jgi:hypothetical protein